MGLFRQLKQGEESFGFDGYGEEGLVRPCFHCRGAVDPPGIVWHGEATLFLHPACAVEFSIRLLRDVHQVECEFGKSLVMVHGTDNREVPDGYVYFVEAVGSDRIKIGFAENVEKRIVALQTSCPFRLSLLLFVPGTYDVEREMHVRFNHLRQTGEWFSATQELRDYIQRQGGDGGAGCQQLRD